MSEKNEKAQYAKSAQEVDLEERIANGNASTRVVSTADSYEGDTTHGAREYAVDGNDLSGYVNTDPVYQTYANPTEKPLVAEGGPEQELEKVFAEQELSLTNDWTSENSSESEDEAGDDEDKSEAPKPPAKKAAAPPQS